MTKYWLRPLAIAIALTLGSCAADLRPTLTPQPGAGQNIIYEHGRPTIVSSALNRVEALLFPNELNSSRRMLVGVGVYNGTKVPFDVSSEEISVRFSDDGSSLQVVSPAQIRETRQAEVANKKFWAGLSNILGDLSGMYSPTDNAYTKAQREAKYRADIQSADKQNGANQNYLRMLLERQTVQPGKEVGGIIEIDVPQRFSTTRPIEISVRVGAEVHKVLLMVNFSEVN
jgi:hypothetical protein